eukprot:m.45906 g.45906  ORF g.45906 m.45906 type:complete len:1726 (+) comp10908_c0_seq1:122-5299(+)
MACFEAMLLSEFEQPLVVLKEKTGHMHLFRMTPRALVLVYSDGAQVQITSMNIKCFEGSSVPHAPSKKTPSKKFNAEAAETNEAYASLDINKGTLMVSKVDPIVLGCFLSKVRDSISGLEVDATGTREQLIREYESVKGTPADPEIDSPTANPISQGGVLMAKLLGCLPVRMEAEYVMNPTFYHVPLLQTVVGNHLIILPSGFPAKQVTEAKLVFEDGNARGALWLTDACVAQTGECSIIFILGLLRLVVSLDGIQCTDIAEVFDMEVAEEEEGEGTLNDKNHLLFRIGGYTRACCWTDSGDDSVVFGEEANLLNPNQKRMVKVVNGERRKVVTVLNLTHGYVPDLRDQDGWGDGVPILEIQNVYSFLFWMIGQGYTVNLPPDMQLLEGHDIVGPIDPVPVVDTEGQLFVFAEVKLVAENETKLCVYKLTFQEGEHVQAVCYITDQLIVTEFGCIYYSISSLQGDGFEVATEDGGEAFMTLGKFASITNQPASVMTISAPICQVAGMDIVYVTGAGMHPHFQLVLEDQRLIITSLKLVEETYFETQTGKLYQFAPDERDTIFRALYKAKAEHPKAKLNLIAVPKPPEPEQMDDAPEKPSLLSDDEALSIIASSGGKKTKNGSVVCVLVGPGAAGKTTTARSIQNIEFTEERVSTRGGDRLDLMCQLDQDQIVLKEGAMFVKLEGNISHAGRGLALASSADATDGVELDAVINGRETFVQQKELELELEQHEARLRAHDTRNIGQGKGHKPKQKKEAKKLKRATSLQRAQERTKQEGEKGTKATPNKKVEVTQMSRAQQQMIIKGYNGDKANMHDALHVNFFDMGGQMEFKALVEGFLRSGNVTCIFFTLPELLANFTGKESTHHDDNHTGWEHFLSWCNSVVCTSSHGAVLLVGTHADKVPNKSDRVLVSESILKELSQRSHDILSRLVRPEFVIHEDDKELLYFPIDNTLAGRDNGVISLRQTLQKTLAESDVARLEVPLTMRIWQDSINSLAYSVTDPSTVSDACAAVRKRHDAMDTALSVVTLADLLEIYVESFQEQEVTVRDPTFRKWVDAIHALGTITHFNTPLLEHVVVLNPINPLAYMTLLVRDFNLHQLPMDKALQYTDDFKCLVHEGILIPSIIPHFLGQAHLADSRLESLREDQQQQILALMMQFNVCVPMHYGDDVAYLCPGLLKTEVPAVGQLDVEPIEICVAPFMGDRLSRFPLISKEDLVRRTNLPAGFYDRLVAEMTRRSQASSQLIRRPPMLSRSFSRLELGRFTIDILKREDLGCLVIKIFAENALGMLQQIDQMLGAIVTSSFCSLHYELLVEMSSNMYLPIHRLQQFVRSTDGVLDLGDGTRWPRKQIEMDFAPVLPVTVDSDIYHIFISYRQTPESKQQVSAFANELSCQSLGERGQRVATFLDVISLESAQRIDLGFLDALNHSLLYVPLLTPKSIERMQSQEECNKMDFFLLELFVALKLNEAFGFPHIMPLISGAVVPDENGLPSFSDFFSGFKPDSLPDKVNMAMLEEASAFLLKQHKLTVEPMTVREIIQDVLRFKTPLLLWRISTGPDSIQGQRSTATSATATTMTSQPSPLSSLAQSHVNIQRMFAVAAKKSIPAIETALAAFNKGGLGHKHSTRLGRHLSRQKRKHTQNELVLKAVAPVEHNWETKDIDQWGVDDVVAWVKTTSIASCCRKFAKCEVDGPLMLGLLEEDLSDILNLSTLQKRHFLRAREALINSKSS